MSHQDEVFLGHSVARHQNISEETAKLIDSEIRRLIDEAYREATRILNEKRKDWENLAKALLEHETLSGAEINDIIKGKKLDREETGKNTEGRSSSVPKSKKASARAKALDQNDITLLDIIPEPKLSKKDNDSEDESPIDDKIKSSAKLLDKKDQNLKNADKNNIKNSAKNSNKAQSKKNKNDKNNK